MKILAVVIILAFLLNACTPTNQGVYIGNKNPNKTASLYINSFSKVNFEVANPFPNQTLIKVTKLINAQGKNIPLSNAPIDLVPGKYTLYAQWFGFQGEQIIPQGDDKVIFTNNAFKLFSPKYKYKLSFNAKPNMTYVFDIEKTFSNDIKMSPQKICLTEEAHNTPGAETPTLNSSIRYISKNARTIACSK